MIVNPDLNLLNFTGQKIVLDLETTGLQAWEEKIKLIAITDEYANSFVLEMEHYPHEQLKKWIAHLHSCYLIINQNIKFDLDFLLYHFNELFRNIHCTLVTQQVLENGKQNKLNFDLVSILSRQLGITHASGEDKKLMQKSFTRKEIEEAMHLMPSFKIKQFEYAAEDTRHLHKLYEKQMEQIKSNKLEIIYALEMRILPILGKMEVEGCKINSGLWKYQIENYWVPEQKEVIERLDREVERLIKGKSFKYHLNRTKTSYKSLDLFGGYSEKILEDENTFNYGSQDHVIALFNLLGETVPVNKKGDPSVDEGALTVYLTECGDTKLSTFIEILLEYRQISKLLSTYGQNFLDKLDKNGYIHTQYTQTQTETGRLSSKAPNLQNIPAPNSVSPNKDIRKCFIPKEGHKFITCDMSQAEIRIAADYSKETLLIDAMEKGADMHSDLASISYSIIFNQPVVITKANDTIRIGDAEYVLGELRDKHKSVVFAKFYKGGAARVYGVLSKYINTHCPPSARKRISKTISDAFDTKVPALSAYLSGLITEAQQTGRLRSSSFGRIRYFEKDVYGEAANYPIQGTNAESLKIALCNIDKYLTELGVGRIVMNIHDEIVVEIPTEYAKMAAPKIQEIMAQALGYFLKVVKGKASVAIEDYWKK